MSTRLGSGGPHLHCMAKISTTQIIYAGYPFDSGPSHLNRRSTFSLLLWTILGIGKLNKVYTRLGSGGPHPHFVIKNPTSGLSDPFDSGPSHPSVRPFFPPILQRICDTNSASKKYIYGSVVVGRTCILCTGYTITI
jgi:hypothetical protein